MKRSIFGRHQAAFGLLLAGSMALIGAQQLLGAVADAQTTEAVADVHAFQKLPETVASTRQVSAAVSTGQFEDLVRPTPIPTIAPTPVPTALPTPAPTVELAPELTVYETGIASTYGEGDGFEGNLTACGQVFHTNVVQIAHKSLPCGTLVRVEDTDTGRTVDAVVTDRGPYISGRIVDLSWGAFQQLDPTGPGLLHVNVYLLPEES
jgi:rare lipoprotein A (peptidoglycan hydrolase)